jgi:hypothetical protein
MNPYTLFAVAIALSGLMYGAIYLFTFGGF